MAIWFTADHHSGHANIVDFRDRPFDGIADMDDTLVDRWNEVVGPDDEVWHLGNFAHRCGPNHMAEIFAQLAGASKHLVIGAHDRKYTIKLPWRSVQHYAEIIQEGRTIVLFHHPLLAWHRCTRGA